MAQLTQEQQKKIVKLLVDEGLIDVGRVNRIMSGLAVDDMIVTKLLGEGVISDELWTHAIAYSVGVSYVDLVDVHIDPSILAAFSVDVAERNMSVPIGMSEGRLAVAMLEATNVQAIDYLATVSGQPIKAYMASQESISFVLGQYKADLSSVNKAAKSTEEEVAEQTDRVNEENIQTIVQDSPISKALAKILEYAIRSKASDIHIEPLENAVKIRCRIDGILREVMTLPKSIEAALVSRIKIMSNLKIDEHRAPQDGQFSVRAAGKEVDLRIAISPVVWGEQVVIRLLDKTGGTFSLEEMGMVGRSLRVVRKGIKRPNGMILTSGPTGSGKTTTLYALIKEIWDESINIVTLEDPVEYKMEGVNQIQVNPEAGLTFASGLRSILRQDPDVVMVGEIRDKETANLAVQAALTGHLVFSTLHTNSAAGVLPRLLDMDIEPFLIASTVNTVIGQRLVRRVSKAREAYQSSETETAVINSMVGYLLPKSGGDVARVGADLGYDGLPVSGQKSYTLVKGVDSPQAPRGYEGRAGVFEAMDVDEQIQKLITQRATSFEIQRAAMLKGMVNMRQDGILKALSGATTLEEVNRVTSDVA